MSAWLSAWRRSRDAQLYAAAVALTFCLSAYFWWRAPPNFLSEGQLLRFAWPGWEWLPRLDLPPLAFRAWLLAMGFAGAGAAIAFWCGRAGTGALLLAAALVAKLSFFLLDRRLMGNYHYMPFAMGLLCLLFPGRLRIAEALVAAFYVASGALKLNGEWLSGAAIPPEWIGRSLWQYFYLRHHLFLLVGTHWVVFLELFFIFFLFHPSARWRWFILAQLAVFHAISYFVVGYFYPLVMFSLLAIYPISWRRAPQRLGIAGWAILAVFSFLQILPWLGPGDTALTHERTLGALNMFDARSQCQSLLLVQRGTQLLDLSLDPEHFAVRISCEPGMHYGYAKETCRQFPGAEVTLQLQSRRASEEAYHLVVEARDVCRDLQPLHAWGRNAWIR